MLQKDRYTLASNDHLCQGNKDADVQPILTRAYIRYERATIWFYELVSFDMKYWSLTVAVQLLILTLQWCHFVSNAYLTYDWTSAAPSVFFAIVNFLVELPWSPFVNFIVSQCVLSLTLFTTLFTAIMHQKLSWVVPVYFTRYVFLWLPSIFFMPLILPFVKMFFGCLAQSTTVSVQHPFYPDIACWDSVHIGLSVLSIVNVACFTYVAVITAAFFYDYSLPTTFQPKDLNPAGRSTNRPDMAIVIAKVLLLILYVAGYSNTWRLPLAALLAAAGVMYVFLHVKLLPFWVPWVQVAYLFKGLVIAWAGVAAAVATLLDDPENTAVLFLIFLPLLVVVAALLMRWRLQVVTEYRQQDLTTPVHVDVAARQLIKNFYAYLRSLGDIYIESDEKLLGMFASGKQTVESVLKFGLERFPESADLRVFIATYYTCVTYNRMIAYRNLQLIDSLQPRIDTRYRTYAMRLMLAEATRAQQSGEIESYLEFKHRRNAVEVAITNAMRQLVLFWTELFEKRPDIDKLSEIGHSARGYLQESSSHCERLLDLNPHSIPVLRLFGMLCLEITGETGRAMEMFALADQLQMSKRQQMLEYDYGSAFHDISTKLDIFDEDNAVVSLSVQEDSLGIIEGVNDVFLRTFGYLKRSDLEGKNISRIIPQPIASRHDEFLRTFVQSKTSNVVNRTRLVLGLTSTNHLIAVCMYVRFSDEAAGKMIAVMHAVANSHEVCALLDPETKRITSATANLGSIFGFSRRDLLSGIISLHDLVPELQDSDKDVVDNVTEALYRKTGYEGVCAHSITQQRFHCHSHLSSHTLRDCNFLLFRCITRQFENHAVESEYEGDDSDHSLTIHDAHVYSEDESGAERGGYAGKDACMSLRDSGRLHDSGHARTASGGSDNAISGRDSGRVRSIDGGESARMGRAGDASLVSALTQSIAAERAAAEEKGSSGDRDSGRGSGMGVSLLSPIPTTTHADNPNTTFPPLTHSSSSSSSSSPSRSADHLSMLPSTAEATTLAVSSFSFQPVPCPLSPHSSSSSSSSPHLASDQCHSLSAHTHANIHKDTAAGRGNAAAAQSLPHLPLTGTTVSTNTASADAAVTTSSLPLASHSTPRTLSSSASASNASLSPHSHPIALPVLTQAMSQLDTPLPSSPHPHSPVPAKPLEKERDADKTNSLDAAIRRRRLDRGRMKLKKAIENDAARTSRRLTWMNVAAFSMICIVLLLNVLVYVLSNIYMDDAVVLAGNVNRSSQRQTLFMDMIYNFHAYQIMTKYPMAIDLRQAYFKPNFHTAATITDQYFRRLTTTITYTYNLSYQIDTTPTKSSKLRELRYGDSTPILMIHGKEVVEIMMPFRVATSYITSMVRLSNYQNYATNQQDIGYYYAIANGLGKMSTKFLLHTEYLRDEMADEHQKVFQITLAMFLVTLVVVMLLSWLFVRPIVTRTEKAKTQVLGIFQSVPRTIRKTLRRKAYEVYQLMRKSTKEENNDLGRNLREDEDTQTEGAGAASVVNSEFTIATKYSSYSNASSGHATYADLFKRYNAAKTSTHLSLHRSESEKHHENPDPEIRLGPHELAMDTRTGGTSHRGSARHSGRGNGSQRDWSGRSSARSGKDRENLALRAIQGTSNGAAAAVGADHGATSHRGLDVIASHGQMDDERLEAVDEEEEDMHMVESKSLWMRRDMRNLFLKYIFFIFVICVYYGLTLWQVETVTNHIEHLGHALQVANQRAPYLQIALFYARLNLLFSYDDVLSYDPRDPTLVNGPYLYLAQNILRTARSAHTATMYGGEEFGLKYVDLGRMQERLLYESLCGMDLKIAQSYIPTFPAHIIERCTNAYNGVFVKGVYVAMNQAMDGIDTLGSYPEALKHLITGGAPSLPPETVATLLETLQTTEELLNEYVYYFLQMSGEFIYRQMVAAEEGLQNTRTMMVVVFSVLLMCIYVLVFHPLSKRLVASSVQTKSMMLLLPPEIIRHVPAAQQYINNNISNE